MIYKVHARQVTLPETALLSIKNYVHMSLAKGMPTALILLDLSAAFNSIDQFGLFKDAICLGMLLFP